MEFTFTDEQQMIRDSAEAFLAEVAGSEAVRRAMATERGFDDALWKRVTQEMCWQAVHIPEVHGGLGLGYVELAALLEQMGRRLFCSPFFSTVAFGVNALRIAGTEAQCQHHLSAIAQGAMTATLGCVGAGRRWDAAGVTATYAMDGPDAVLDGTLHYVPDGHTADLLIVAARTPGSTGADGIGLFLVHADSAGVRRQWLPTMDQTRKQARVDLTAVRVGAGDIMREPARAWPLLSRIFDLARIATAAEQVGGAQEVLAMTLGYVMERKQFGRAVGGFQSMKHKAADMMLKAEAARSALYYAACTADEFLGDGAPAADLAEAASIAKAYCSDAFFFNAGCALQMHGGVGFTWEYDVHLFFKRAKSSQHLLGDGSYHRERIAERLLDASA